MTQEEKELLLKDLCMRLPYGVKLKHIPSGENTTLEFIGYGVIEGDIHDLIENFKPYLRPLSSMTEEEKREYNLTKTLSIVDYPTLESFDWLLKNHFDFRGLIPKDLAIEVTESNNPYKDLSYEPRRESKSL